MMKRLYTLPLCLALLTGQAHLVRAQDSLIVFPPGTGRVYAVEDTIPVYEVDPVVVVRPRVPLEEIIRKARDGERRKYEGLTTLSYNQTLRVVMIWEGKKPRKRCEEIVQRVFYRAPNDWRVVTLSETKYGIDAAGRRVEANKDENIKFELTDGRRKDYRQLADLPYYLERLDKFTFQIAHRTMNEKQVLYEVDFEPLSDFDNLPAGKMWLLTPNYQIVREEFDMRHRPFPWIVKNVDLLAREWQEIDGRWVEKRITGRVDLGMNFMKVPHRVEFVMSFDEYRFDPALDERIFQGGN
jgi:hypothetical protein